MASDLTPTIGEILTDDLISEILVRVPVKYLLRCKSVCKPWLSLISSPNFINSHMKRSITKPGADQTLIVTNDHLVSLLHLDSRQIGPPLGLPFSRGDFSYEPGFELINSCNGVVCVYVSNFPRPRLVNVYEKNCYDRNNPNIYLWNPATKQSKLIPPPNIHDDIWSLGKGFGFDPIGNDFKVVRIVSLADKPRSAEIYSANTNVWRKLESGFVDDFPSYDDFDICVNGFLLCTGLYGMMAFDLNKEVFNCGIQLPIRYNEACVSVTDFNDCIAFINCDENMINLWTLEDEACLRDGGVEALWTLMLSVDVDLPVWRAYGYFNNSDLLLDTEDGDRLLYNSDKKEARNMPDSYSMRRAIKYSESLVSIEGFKQVDWNAHEDAS